MFLLRCGSLSCVSVTAYIVLAPYSPRILNSGSDSFILALIMQVENESTEVRGGPSHQRTFLISRGPSVFLELTQPVGARTPGGPRTWSSRRPGWKQPSGPKGTQSRFCFLQKTEWQGDLLHSGVYFTSFFLSSPWVLTSAYSVHAAFLSTVQMAVAQGHRAHGGRFVGVFFFSYCSRLAWICLNRSNMSRTVLCGGPYCGGNPPFLALFSKT